ncbi:hypothetical protein R6Q59_025201 [Mikania micrantha]
MQHSMTNRSHKTFFMPLLCRSSRNDVVKPPSDPSSPKLTCIGQIKKRSTTTTDRFLVCSLSDSTTVRSSRYTKLHKLFSGRNLISPAIETAPINKFNSKSVTNRSKSCNGRGRIPIGKNEYYISGADHAVLVDVVEDMDPPLPVVKCCRRDQESNVNLWKRRGIEIKSLQIQPIQLNMNQNTSNNKLTMADFCFRRRQQPSEEQIHL